MINFIIMCFLLITQTSLQSRLHCTDCECDIYVFDIINTHLYSNVDLDCLGNL